MRSLAIVVGVALMAGPALADWPHSVKWDQTIYGVDNYAGASWIDLDTPSDAQTADDFLCDGTIEHRYITDLEFHGWSYYGSQYIDKFRVQFWTDVPRTANDQSHPGTLLYSYDVPAANANDPLHIGWYEPEAGKFKIDLPENYWFDQGLGAKVLWVSIQGVMVSDGFFDAFYWNFQDRTFPVWGDDAAFMSNYYGYAPWYSWGFPSADVNIGPDLYDGVYPTGWFNSADMDFKLTAFPEPASVALLVLGGILLRRR